MKGIGHMMILASAGSGKTYTLTNRFVQLLAMGAKPERVVALTFTRKAAGEFFDEILNKLARAATQPAAARQLAQAIEFPQLGPADFRRMLRGVVDAMPRLRLGTFDGFFARIARNFPIELGLTGEFELLQEHASKQERARVLQRLFQHAGTLTSAQTEFIESFKRATFGMDEKQLGARLDRFLDEHQEVFLGAPLAENWGNPDRIWPEGAEWFGTTVSEVKGAVEVMRNWLERSSLAEKSRDRWQHFLTELTEWSPGAPMPTALGFVVEKALKAWPQLKEGKATLEFFRQKQELDQAQCAALTILLRHVVGGEIGRQLEITRGLHAVLHGYESVYHDAVRRAGKLTFGDVQRLLAPGEDGAKVLSRVMSEDGRLYIDFRLDAEIDHWLLDEFQDTSFGQWSVLKNLVDEVVQDTSGTRSFFYVGDIKQAIFAWREGDPRLFREIFDHYNSTSTGLIEEKHLLKSYRSGPPVVTMVNRVFGDAPAIAQLFPGEASAPWNREWRQHESAQFDLGGQVALLHADDAAERFRMVMDLLLEIEPLERGLSCAVLVQKNETAALLVDYLRREGGVAAVAESDLHVCTDNPLGAALLALVKVAAHPGDRLAREHVAMTPLGALLVEDGAADADALTRRVLGQVHAEGFERTMEHWLQRILPRLSIHDRFTPERGRQFTAAAALFDATGSRNVSEFIAFMERHTLREAEPAAAVRVMTIHKAKGLGFDLVILPDLEGKKLESRRDGLAVQRAGDRTIDWVMGLPAKELLSQDTVLSRHVRAAESDGCYEKLSLLYVAMTRAKRAMYVITKPPGTSTSRNFPKLLADTLGEDGNVVHVGKLELAGAYAEGEADWFRPIVIPRAAVTPKDESPLLAPGEKMRLPRLPSRRPSEKSAGWIDGSRLFALPGKDGPAEFGREVHGLLAEVTWTTAEDAARKYASWAARGRAGELALSCLFAPALAGVWKPRAHGDVWRERTFEIVLGGTWVTGVFDRVVIERDAAGRAIKAIVYDFKTDVDEREIEGRYAVQLSLYRKAAALLAGLAITSVSCEIVLTRQQRRLPLLATP